MANKRQRDPEAIRERGQLATAGPEELERFLAEHPDTQFVDAVFIDLCGFVRGKRYPRAEAEKLFNSGLQIPYSVYLLDVTGANLDPCGRGFSDGDPDGTALPLSGTLAPVPWSSRPGAQVLMTLLDQGGRPCTAEPRNIALRVAERFRELGLRPVTAFELEFYLIDRERDADGRPQPVISPATGEREKSTQVYGIEELGAFSGFFDDVEAACLAQRVPATVTTSEFAPAQYEINLRHMEPPITSADHCALLRNIVKTIAKQHGMEATFLSKPFPDETGNGMHVHLSLLEESGRNVFDDGTANGSELLRHAVGGLQATMAEGMALFAPNINAYRRFGPNLFVPVTKSWGFNNRSVAFRIPGGPGKDRRIEHRVAGAEANPYLVLAAVLAGAHHGIVDRLDPGPPSTGNAGAETDPDLPLSWEKALERLEGSDILRAYFGDEYVRLYCATKRKEMERFNAHVSPLEYEWYL
ncbi:MAG: glutamine synthetase [Gammaproteobacteria bacterium]|nr:glutamine synthetase [Gammaproteobacteria bacterium]NIR83888.1 glutamine synthetase [Gammaproteobacteria bacterium]NIR90667.1 glutamine synthetase [Gammaproteobacteria bacterium]NIV76056.1 glutamine synthetase [Gammaproteobacteria bacterium]